MANPVIAMIGAGNMGSSLIGGMIKNGHPAENLIATDPSSEKLQHMQQALGIQITTDNAEAVSKADVVIFAVKPQTFADVATSLQDTLQTKKPLVVSIAAGVTETLIQKWVGGNLAIVRVMPNTPSLIGAGASGLYANAQTSSTQRNIAESIMRAVGVTVWVNEEEQMDTVTALSGSGPAYYFLIMEAMQQAAQDAGLPESAARLLSQQTALGAAMMATESDKTPEELRKNVTSPGGTTERAISVLEENKVRDIFKKAIMGAKERSVELANMLGDK